MKKIVAILLSLTFFVNISFLTTTTVNAADNFSEDQSGFTRIYNKDGKEIESIEIPVLPNIFIRSKYQPTKVKNLRKGEGYISNAFSGSGMRYGGYIFHLEGFHIAQIYATGGNFVLYVSNHHTGVHVIQAFLLRSDRSPYTIDSYQWFYFGVNNPVNYQSYMILT